MGRIIKTFPGGCMLEYDRGSFDDWCVYLTGPDGRRSPPRDLAYFTRLKRYAAKHGANRLYADFVRLYHRTGKDVEEAVLAAITRTAAAYGEEALGVDIVFTILYMGMIAEERRENTRLGKRIKRLGMHILLAENASPAAAAHFMRGMGWREIDRLCRERGF